MTGPRVLIEGIGGVGGVIAGGLLRAGVDCALVTGNAAIADAITRRGLEVRTPEGAHRVEARAAATLDDVDGPFDVALLAMKAQRVVEVARATAPRLATDGYVVTLQNGVVEDDVAAAIGADRVVGGIVGWGATLHAPGVCERTSAGALHLGELDAPAGDRLRALAELLGAVGDVAPTDNLRGALWSKLAINCTITTGGALTGETLGQMLRRREARGAFLAVYREVVDTAEAHGVALERIAAHPRTLYVPADASPFTRWGKDVLMRFVGRRYRDLRSSSLQSIERGRPTEVDFLNGYVVRKTTELDRPAPVNEALVRMIHEIEAGERPLSPANVDALADVVSAG